ncbi:hypothetical protein HYALB_00003704 [Hymenoscyphus albidus]|uniref:60S ribosomal protein L34 n=1 Tax=Hymenoscyphus albidus TaxID=595503 RepID=A0A9N9LLY5_9HELO|nr:hypothetical protein HYALB_00003704 [Hymenoscyphus albidus]
MTSNRLTYRRRNPYNTKSNKVRVVKTPGGELRYLHIKKAGTAPKCGDCGIKLPGVSYFSIAVFSRWKGTWRWVAGKMEFGLRDGFAQTQDRVGNEFASSAHYSRSTQDRFNTSDAIPALRPREYAQISRPKKTVQRAYGGSRCANCVRDRIVRAFLIEEQKIVKKVLKESQQKKR